MSTPLSHCQICSPRIPAQSGNPPPDAEFPKFDGDKPRLWRRACEKYFRVYNVATDYWVEYATMHLIGNDALWFQSAEDKMGSVTWIELCEIISKHFDRGHYQLLYRQSFKIRQTSTVSEYVERFNTIMHHMLAYKPDLDLMFFTTHFIDGLQKEIKSIVLIQQPEELETAVSLALLQEEIGEEGDKLHSYNRNNAFARVNSKAFASSTFSAATKIRPSSTPEEKKTTEGAKHTTSAQKFQALKAYRRAMGLCFWCGEKFSPTHKCATTVQFHVVEELLNMLDGSESPHSFTTAVDGDEELEQDLYAISQQAAVGTEDNTCFRLQGTIQGKDVLMLIDSGSSGNFNSNELAAKLQGVTKLDKPVKVKVANGAIL